MNDHWVYTDSFQKDDVFCKIACCLGITHGMAAIFHDESAPGIPLKIGKRLDQHFGFREVRCSVAFYRCAHDRLSFLFANALLPKQPVAGRLAA